MSVDNLLNFNGANLSQVFTDDGVNPAVWVVENGSPVISTDQFKFGSASLFLDGLSNLITSDFDLGDSSNTTWTLECWVWLDPAMTSSGVIINFDNTTLKGLQWTNNGSGSFSWYDVTDRCYVDVEQTPVEKSTWYHVAVTNDNGLITLFCNGVSSRSKFRSTYDYTGHSVRVGKYGSGATVNAPFSGYIDGLRFTPNEILYNALSNPTNIPSSELTTTTTAAPTMPSTNSKNERLKSSVATNIVKELADTSTVRDNGGNGGVAPEPDPTSTNIIAGNVKKLGLPFGARVVVTSVGITPEVVGSGESDSITGDYSIDVYPYTNECLIYVAPDYGNDFVVSSFVGADTIIHPTVPNGNVYVAQNGGTVGATEPVWPTEGLINSGGVSFLTVPLHRPLMNGFIKPTVTPI